MALDIRPTRWGWTLFHEGEIVASAARAAELWPLARGLEMI